VSNVVVGEQLVTGQGPFATVVADEESAMLNRTADDSYRAASRRATRARTQAQSTNPP
jgi:hypothetical protein